MYARAQVKWAPLEGGAAHVVAAGGTARVLGLAVDHAAGLLYYSAGGALSVAELHGERPATLLHDGFDNLTALAVDPLR